MNQIPQNEQPVEPIADYPPTRLGRRAVLSLMTGIGLAAGGVVALPGSVTARLKQTDATPEAPVQDIEAAPATPELGEQADGTVTWRVQAGHMDMEIGVEVMGFFPEAITINAGDRIFYDVHGLHTMTFLGEQQPPPFIVPEAQALGTPAPAGDVGSRWALNPVAAFPSGPPVHAGTGYVNSGIPDPTAPPFVLEFTEPGTFEYLCLVHPKYMKARVVVQEQGADRPLDQDAYDQQATEQMDAILEQGRSLIEQHSMAEQATPVAGGGAIWDVVAGVGQEQAQVLRFLPDRLDIRAGDTVRWTSHAGQEPHTVTFPGEH